MRLLRNASLAFALAFAAAGARAQEGPTLTLEEAVAIALDQNFEVEIAKKSLESAQTANTPGNAGLLPTVALSASAQEQIDDSELTLVLGSEDGEQRQEISQSGVNTTTLNAGLGVSYALPNLVSNFYRQKSLEIRDEQARAQLALQTEAIAAQVSAAYVQAARLRTALDINEAFIELSQERLERARARQEYGGGNSLQALQAEVDLKNDSAAYRNADLAYRNAKRDLNYLLARSPEEPFQVNTELPYRPDLDYVSLEQSLQDRSPALLAARKALALSQKQAESAEWNWAPTLSASVDYGYFRQETEVGVLQSNQTIGLTGAVSLNMPIYSGGQRRIERETARIAAEQSRMSLEQTRLDLRRRLANAFATYQNGMAQLDIEESNLPTFRLNFEKSQEDYRRGQISATDLRAAQLNLQQARDRVANLRYDVKLSEIELLRLSGLLLEGQD